jgi:hypothetical protein
MGIFLVRTLTASPKEIMQATVRLGDAEKT